MAGMYMPLFGLSAERGALSATLATLTNLRYVLEPGGFRHEYCFLSLHWPIVGVVSESG